MTALQLLIRVDADAAIGYGHLRRCGAIAEQYRAEGIGAVRFLSRPTSDVRTITRAGFDVILMNSGELAEDGRWLQDHVGPVLVDTPHFDWPALDGVGRPGFIVAFTDGAVPRPWHRCAIDYTRIETARAPGVSDGEWLVGPQYFPMSGEFAHVQPRGSTRDAVRVVITFGGSDSEDHSSRVVAELASLAMELHVILGPAYCGQLNEASFGATIIRDPADMAAVLADTDVAVSAAGGTALELAFLGIPTVLVSTAVDQHGIAKGLSTCGAASWLGEATTCSADRLRGEVHKLVNDGPRRQHMSAMGRRAVDGQGARRIVRAIQRSWLDVLEREAAR
jgi:spore coat polysaccharide biosynthesis predicted glycosyltransferase SpsG